MQKNEPTASAEQASPKLSILIAEDDADERLLLERAFKKSGVGARVRFVCDGQQAIDCLSGTPLLNGGAPEPVPQLLLLDLKMPVMNGFEVLQWLRLRPSFRDLLVIVLSNSNLPEDMVRARSLGARHYLVKPRDFNEMLRLVANLERLWRTLSSPGMREPSPESSG